MGNWLEKFFQSKEESDDEKVITTSGVYQPENSNKDTVIEHDRLTIDKNSGSHTHESHSYCPSTGQSKTYYGGSNSDDRSYNKK